MGPFKKIVRHTHILDIVGERTIVRENSTTSPVAGFSACALHRLSAGSTKTKSHCFDYWSDQCTRRVMIVLGVLQCEIRRGFSQKQTVDPQKKTVSRTLAVDVRISGSFCGHL